MSDVNFVQIDESSFIPFTFNEYQVEARKTAIYPDIGHNLYYPALGLGGETGEVLEKIKKLYRDNNGVVTEEFKAALSKELGDILWYLGAVASEAGIYLNDVAKGNIEKLRSRQERGTLKGSGDNR